MASHDVRGTSADGTQPEVHAHARPEQVVREPQREVAVAGVGHTRPRPRLELPTEEAVERVAYPGGAVVTVVVVSIGAVLGQRVPLQERLQAPHLVRCERQLLELDRAVLGAIGGELTLDVESAIQ